MSFVPFLVSEREPGGWEDCVWATGVMVANEAVGENRYPATRYEYEGLRFAATGVREASGDGSTYGELETGLLTRYRLPFIRRGIGFDGAMAQSSLFTLLAVQGLYAALPSRLRISSFTGGHSAAFYRDRDTSGLWLDPLAANGSQPTRITNDEVRRYYEALRGAEWIAMHEREAYSQPMIVFALERWKLPAGTRIYETPNGIQITVLGNETVLTTIGYPNDHSADGVDYGWRAVIVSTKALDGILRSKIAFIKRPSGTALSTPAAWDAAVMKTLLDPSFTGGAGTVVDASAAQIAAAKKAGVIDGVRQAGGAIDVLETKVGG